MSNGPKGARQSIFLPPCFLLRGERAWKYLSIGGLRVSNGPPGEKLRAFKFMTPAGGVVLGSKRRHWLSSALIVPEKGEVGLICYDINPLNIPDKSLPPMSILKDWGRSIGRKTPKNLVFEKHEI